MERTSGFIPRATPFNLSTLSLQPGVLYVNIIDDYWQAAYEERPVRDIVFYDPIIVGEDGIIYRYVKPPMSDDESDEDMLPEDLPDEDLPHEELPIEKKVEEEGLLKAAGSLMKQVVGGLVISALKAEALQLFS